MSAPCHCKHVDDSSSNDKLSALSPELQQEFKDPNHPANLICELCRLFYDNNWVTGTGGGISIRDVDGTNPNLVYIAPSGVQRKEFNHGKCFWLNCPMKNLTYS